MEENELRAFVCVRDAAMKNEGSRSVDGEAEVPTPRVFFVRVANKGVRFDGARNSGREKDLKWLDFQRVASGVQEWQGKELRE
jgi:hypothetical protein